MCKMLQNLIEATMLPFLNGNTCDRIIKRMIFLARWLCHEAFLFYEALFGLFDDRLCTMKTQPFACLSSFI
uniref:Uncharacterized protein n=1 Tax=Arundo donax TaxID=35708 RepID=A0A0A9AE93_ARUDO